MKNKFLLVALISVLLVTGMVIASCRIGCPGDGQCTFTWTGLLPKYSGCFDGSNSKKAVDCSIDLIKQFGNNSSAKARCGC